MLFRIARFEQLRRFHVSRRHSKILEWIKSAAAIETENSFAPELIEKMHKIDKMSPARYFLIYRDPGAAHSHGIMAIAAPLAIFGFSLLVFDLALSEEAEWMASTKKLTKDIREIGYFSIVPGITFLLVVATLIRFQQLRVMRIYQDKKSPQNFHAIVTKSFCFKAKYNFTRGECIPLIPYEGPNAWRQLITTTYMGTTRFKDRNFLLNDDKFRTNSHRSYMLNETSGVPRFK
ncbi:unnamed protein product, partial [Mesorhabditis belari]|uniref:Uncharacterized protein n=1 Tax=Mesorhabditis belari TaxID=2138241 RepID=A0AAF3FGB6_9BILA